MQSLVLLAILLVAILVIAILFTNRSIEDRDEKYKNERVYPNKKW